MITQTETITRFRHERNGSLRMRPHHGMDRFDLANCLESAARAMRTVSSDEPRSGPRSDLAGDLRLIASEIERQLM